MGAQARRARIKQDLDKAEELLDEAGWNDTDGDGIRDKDDRRQEGDVRFQVIHVSNRQDRIDICNLLKQNLDQIGDRVQRPSRWNSRCSARS